MKTLIAAAPDGLESLRGSITDGELRTAFLANDNGRMRRRLAAMDELTAEKCRAEIRAAKVAKAVLRSRLR